MFRLGMLASLSWVTLTSILQLGGLRDECLGGSGDGVHSCGFQSCCTVRLDNGISIFFSGLTSLSTSSSSIPSSSSSVCSVSESDLYSDILIVSTSL